jgi:hypothetical protein
MSQDWTVIYSLFSEVMKKLEANDHNRPTVANCAFQENVMQKVNPNTNTRLLLTLSRFSS